MRRKDIEALIEDKPNQLFYYGTRGGSLKTYEAWKKNSKPKLVRLRFNKFGHLCVGKLRTGEWSGNVTDDDIHWDSGFTALQLVLATKEDGDALIEEYKIAQQNEALGLEAPARVSVIMRGRAIPPHCKGDEMRVAGRQLAYRNDRDLPVVLAEDVVVLAGNFPATGGSFFQPMIFGRSPLDEALALEIRNVDVRVARQIVAKTPWPIRHLVSIYLAKDTEPSAHTSHLVVAMEDVTVAVRAAREAGATTKQIAQAVRFVMAE